MSVSFSTFIRRASPNGLHSCSDTVVVAGVMLLPNNIPAAVLFRRRGLHSAVSPAVTLCSIWPILPIAWLMIEWYTDYG